MRLLTGADGCETWSHQRLWDAFLTNVRVVVATPAILLDALDHAFVRMASLALIVFDEGDSTPSPLPDTSFHPRHSTPLPPSPPLALNTLMIRSTSLHEKTPHAWHHGSLLSSCSASWRTGASHLGVNRESRKIL